jgi:hypothetical protein
MRRAVRGVFSEDFMTQTHPHARRGAHFQANIRIGKFQGMMPGESEGSYVKGKHNLEILSARLEDSDNYL